MNVDGQTKIIGLFGNPVSHSLSPFIHNKAFKEINENYIYLAFNANKETIEDVIKSIKTLNIAGGNVTFPIKKDFVKYCDILDLTAEMTGAVNVFKVENSKIVGYNKDGEGFVKSLEEKKIDYKNMNILLLGAGGAGSAIATSLSLNSAKRVIIKGRTIEKPLELKNRIEEAIKDSKIEIIDDNANLSDILKNVDLIINATNVGMNEDKSPLEDVILPKNIIVYDIIYSPLETRLIKSAKENNIKAFNGVSMLVHQAELSFEVWTGKKFDIKEMEEKIYEVLK